MSERSRNIAVGVTVLVSFLVIAGMIMIFTTLPAVFQGGYAVRMLSDSSYGIEAGYPVQYKDIRVGFVRDVAFTDGDPARGVTLTVRIDRDVRLPGNTTAIVFTKGFVGSPYVALVPAGAAPLDPRTGQPRQYLPTDGSGAIALTRDNTGIIPIPDDLKNAIDDLRTGFKDLGALARNLNELLSGPAASSGPADGNAVATATGPAAPSARAMLAKLSVALDGIAAMVGDKENQQNLKVSLAGLSKVATQGTDMMVLLRDALGQTTATLQNVNAAIRTTTQMVDKAGDTVDKLSAKLLDDADKLAVLMTGLNKIVAKLDSTDGTVGKLINDPKLYNSLLDITNQLNGLMKEFRVLLETWEKSGVGIKLK